MKQLLSAIFSMVFIVSASPCRAEIPGSENAPDANTVGLWHFNEGTGATASDASSSGNDGTITGATWTTEGKFGNALDFDGSGDGIQIANPFSGVHNNFTVEAWINIEGFPGVPQDFGEIFRHRGTYQDLALAVLSSQKFYVQVIDQTSTYHTYTSQTTLLPGVWYHVAATYNGSVFRFYLNGELDLEATETYDMDWSAAYIGTAIGDNPFDSNHEYSFNGIIDEVRISNIARQFEAPDLQITQKIVFQTNRDGNDEIYMMNPDTSGLTRLTTNTAGEQNPNGSPDGRKVAYQSTQDGNWEIYEVDVSDLSLKRLTTDGAIDGSPTWSPDGLQVAFESNRDGDFEIYVMNAEVGSSPGPRTDNSATDGDPAWSPDGTKIAFYSSRDGNSEVYVMNADGNSETNLSNNSANDAMPAWSPDGSKLLFQSERDGNPEIYVMDADGMNQTRLTYTSANESYPSWSPDGSKIVFISKRDGNNEIYVMDADGSNQTRLTNEPAVDSQTDWFQFRHIGSPLCLY